ncbi:MAG TPA: ArsA-related P-loop ATPase [Solirubrobacteraceae bacterium]|nr:ArsA-related P-loop ATPase [Solirubrobacteraceae bacterium]
MSPVVTPTPKPALWPIDMPLEPRPRGPLWIGVAGKGGSGKSVLSGTLARELGRRGHSVLAIDSDPMPGLAHSLGIDEPEEPLLMQAAEKPEKGPWRLKPGIGPMTVVRKYTTLAPDGVRMLQLGKSGKDGLAPINGSVNAFLDTVRRMHETPTLYRWAIVGDLPAGPRQLGAGFSPYARVYIVVVEATSQSAMTARRVARLARGPLGADVVFAASKVSGGEDRERVERLLGEKVDIEIPADQAVRDAEARQVAVIDDAPGSPVVRAVQQLADIIEQRGMESS